MTITEILQEWNAGDATALQRLMPIVYDQFHRLAENRLRQERLTIQPTELVHEAFLRLMQIESPDFRDRVHFFGAAASVMRRILVDLARRRSAAKRDAVLVQVDLDAVALRPELQLEALHDALTRLEEIDAQQARVVELRFFGGLSIAETAEVLGVSVATVKRDWLVAKAWLMRDLFGNGS